MPARFVVFARGQRGAFAATAALLSSTAFSSIETRGAPTYRRLRPLGHRLVSSRGERGAFALGQAPDDRWSLAELTDRILAEGQRIDAAEKSATPRCWYQGKALNAAEKHLKKGKWGEYLKTCALTTDQARSRRKLAELYDSPDGLKDVSVREALRRAKGDAPDPTTARLLRNLAVRARNLVKATRLVGERVKTSAERAALATSIERAVAALAPLHAAGEQGDDS